MRTRALLAFLVLLVVAPSGSFGSEDRLRELEAENARLRQELQTARQEVEDLRIERGKLQTLAALPPKETPAARLMSEFDPETRRTRVESKPMVIPATLRGLDVPHRLGVRFAFAGTTVDAPIEEALIVITTQANTNSRYAGLSEIAIQSDGTSMPLALESYRVVKKIRSGMGGKNVRIDEELLVVGDRELFRTLALAQDLTLAIGSRELELSRDHHALIAAVYERMRGSGTASLANP